MLIAVPGWPLPTFSTASIASTRTVSMARRSSSPNPSGRVGGGWRGSPVGASVAASAGASDSVLLVASSVVIGLSCSLGSAVRDPPGRSAATVGPGRTAVPGSSDRSRVSHGPAARHQDAPSSSRSEEHTSELQSRQYLVCRLLLEKKNIHDQRQT